MPSNKSGNGKILQRKNLDIKAERERISTFTYTKHLHVYLHIRVSGGWTVGTGFEERSTRPRAFNTSLAQRRAAGSESASHTGYYVLLAHGKD